MPFWPTMRNDATRISTLARPRGEVVHGSRNFTTCQQAPFLSFFSLDVTIGLRVYSQSVPQIVGFAITKLRKNVMEISCRLLYRCQKDEGKRKKIPEEMHLSGVFFVKHFSFYEIDTDRLRVWTLDSEGGR